MGRVATTYTPPAKKDQALKDLVKEINYIKDCLEGKEEKEKLFEPTLEKLRQMWDSRDFDLPKWVKLLNEKKYLTYRVFELRTVYGKDGCEYQLIAEGYY